MGKKITNTPCHCTRLHRSEENVTRFYDRCLRPSGVTARQYALLRQIQLHLGCSVRELADVTELDRSTLTRNLKVLFRQEYIVDRKKMGKRNSQLYLTPVGEKVCKQANTLWEKAQREYEEKIGPENVAELERILLKLQDL